MISSSPCSSYHSGSLSLGKPSLPSFWLGSDSLLSSILAQCDLPDTDADDYFPRQIGVCLSLDDFRVCNNICSISYCDGYDGSVRSCETDNEVFSLEYNKEDMISQVRLRSLLSN